MEDPSNDSPPNLAPEKKVRKPRGPDKKPRKKKSDALNLLLDVKNGPSSSASDPLEDEDTIEVRKVMDFPDLLDTVAPKKRKRGPNKNPRGAKRMKLDESQEIVESVEATATSSSFPTAPQPPPQPAVPFVMKTAEELLKNWNFNEYILGLPYQLANPAEVSLNLRVQEQTERIKAFNLLTNPSSSTYDPTLSTRRQEPEVPPTKPPVPAVQAPAPPPVVQHPGAPLNSQMTQHLQQLQKIQSANPAWQHMVMMHAMQQHHAAMMQGKLPMSYPMPAQVQDRQNPGPPTPQQPQLIPVKPQPVFPNQMAHPSPTPVQAKKRARRSYATPKHPLVPQAPQQMDQPQMSHPSWAHAQPHQESRAPGFQTTYAQIPQSQPTPSPMAHPSGPVINPAHPPLQQSHPPASRPPSFQNPSAQAPQSMPVPIPPPSWTHAPSGAPGFQNHGAPDQQSQPVPNLMTHPSWTHAQPHQESRAPGFQTTCAQIPQSQPTPSPMAHPSGPAINPAHPPLQQSHPPASGPPNFQNPSAQAPQSMPVPIPPLSWTHASPGAPAFQTPSPQVQQSQPVPNLMPHPSWAHAQPHHGSGVTGFQSPCVQTQPPQSVPNPMAHSSGPAINPAYPPQNIQNQPPASGGPNFQNLGAQTSQSQAMAHPSGPAAQSMFPPLPPLNIQNFIQNLPPQCTSSGRTTATLTPGLNAISDSSNNSSPTC